MGRISDKTKYPQDGSLQSTDYLIGTDTVGATRTYNLELLAKFFAAFFNRMKYPTSSLYDGFIIITGEGNLDNTTVEAGDYMIGSSASVSGGEFIIARVLVNSPTTFVENTDIDTLINLR